MFRIFRSPSQLKQLFKETWPIIMEQAKVSLPPELPKLERRNAKWFIDDWNRQYESATDEEKIGLAVLAYRVDIHRYAAGMLIEGKKETRMAGIRILGYMRDESAWAILKERLLQHPDPDLSLASLNALFQINERRAREELEIDIKQRTDWPTDKLNTVLQSFYPNGSF